MSDNASNLAAGAPAGMPCPRCRVDLLMTDRQGVEIDYCPKCRGVWLDRGELDKIIERNAQYSTATPEPAPAPGPWAAPTAPPPGVPQPTQPAAPAPGWGQGYDQGHGHWHGGGHGGGHYGGRGHNSFLGRLFG
jgi:Zn-finger nucleic acid-binding protein